MPYPPVEKEPTLTEELRAVKEAVIYLDPRNDDILNDGDGIAELCERAADKIDKLHGIALRALQEAGCTPHAIQEILSEP